jgi:hypothetical protein
MRGLLLPKGVVPDDFLLQLRTDIAEIIRAEKAQLAPLSGPDLRAYMLGAINKYFAEQVKMRPLVQLLIQEVKSESVVRTAQEQRRDTA